MTTAANRDSVLHLLSDLDTDELGFGSSAAESSAPVAIVDSLVARAPEPAPPPAPPPSAVVPPAPGDASSADAATPGSIWLDGDALSLSLLCRDGEARLLSVTDNVLV